MPSPRYHDHPSVIVNGVCSSVYVDDYVNRYCDQGEEGPHTYHEAQMSADKPAWYWTDTNPNALNDPHVMERLSK